MLGNYGPGIAFALARSKEEALNLIKKQVFGDELESGDEWANDEIVDAPPDKPGRKYGPYFTVHVKPVAFCLWGSC